MNMKHIIILLVALTCSFLQVKADDIPSIDIWATFITSGRRRDGHELSGSAPLTVRFAANAENVGAWSAHEWRSQEGNDSPYLVRYMRRTRNIRSRRLALTA